MKSKIERNKIWRKRKRKYIWKIFLSFDLRFPLPLSFESTYKQPPEVFYRKSCFLKIFAIFTGRHVCRNLFLMKLYASRPTTLLKRDSSTDVSLWILRNFTEQQLRRAATSKSQSKRSVLCSVFIESAIESAIKTNTE